MEKQTTTNKNQTMNSTQTTTNSVLTLKLTTMKKQLVLFILAVLAGFTTVYGQTCTDGPLSPAAGTPYTYKVLIGNPPYNSATGSFTWYVTTNVDLLNAGSIVPSPGDIIATGAYNTATVGEDQIVITWTAQAIVNGIANPYYLVVKFAGNNGVCDAMNMKVWQITPINKFLLAVFPMGGAGGDGTVCPSDIVSATVTPGSSPTVDYEYGVTSLYARVMASNYAGDWKPSFKIDGLDPVQQLTSVTWATDSLFATPHTTTLASNVATSTDLATAAFDGSLKIWVKVDIDNKSFETLADQPITIGVDGIITVGATTLDDVVSNTDCSPEVAFGKTVAETIKARPTVTPDPATGPFITKMP
jgi:hypothetical protein